MHKIVFWQGIASPHMASLANELGARCNEVHYVAAEEMSSLRQRQGWIKPDMRDMQFHLINGPSEALSLLNGFPNDAIHLTQGVRGNGYISAVIRTLRQRHARWGAIMETIDERFGLGPLKRLVYAWHLGRAATRPDFVLAIGKKTKPWLTVCDYPAERVFEFTYFLPQASVILNDVQSGNVFRVGFVGQLIQRKRVDILIDALACLLEFPFELLMIGTGPLEGQLHRWSIAKLGLERFRMMGQLSMAEARICMQNLDCLVLPSVHDGWGAVVSEALMVGVPVICSDACGAATAVQASRVGGVFPKGDVAALRGQLRQMFVQQPLELEKRRALAAWAHCLSSVAGADYLISILDSIYHGAERPLPPWEARA